MIRQLTVLGVVLVVMGGSLTAIAGTSSSEFPPPGIEETQQAQDEEEAQDATPVPSPAATAEPDPTTNRENCDAIRGTDYLSPEERTWYLGNCVVQ